MRYETGSCMVDKTLAAQHTSIHCVLFFNHKSAVSTQPYIKTQCRCKSLEIQALLLHLLVCIKNVDISVLNRVKKCVEEISSNMPCLSGYFTKLWFNFVYQCRYQLRNYNLLVNSNSYLKQGGLITDRLWIQKIFNIKI